MKCTYKVRIDLGIVSLDSVVGAVHGYDALAYVVEGSMTENPHIHLLLTTTVKEKTLRARFRKLGLKGNGGYSMKEMTEEFPLEYMAYMMKEGKPEWINFPPEKIEEAIAHDMKVKAEMKLKKESRKGVIIMIEKEVLSEPVVPVLAEMPLYGDLNHHGYVAVRKILAVRLRQWIVKKDKIYNRNQIRNYIDTLIARNFEEYVKYLDEDVL